VPSLKLRRNNAWFGFVAPSPLTVTMLVPGGNGQTKELPFTFSFDTSDNEDVTKVELYYFVGDVPTKIGEATEFNTFGWTVDLPTSWTPGTHTFFGRAHYSGGTVDSPWRAMTTTFGVTTNLTWANPTTDGAHLDEDDSVAWVTNNPSSITQVRLYKLVGSTETLLGATSTYDIFGYAIDTPSPPGSYYLFGRAMLSAGGSVDSSIRLVHVDPDPVEPPPGSASLKTALYFGGSSEHWDEARRRMGYNLSGRMAFAMASNWPAIKNDFSNHINAVVARRSSARYMMWITVRLLPKQNAATLSQSANGADNTHWDDMGDILNRLTEDDLRHLFGMRLGHEFMNGGADYPHGIRNTAHNGPNLRTNAGSFAAAWRNAVNHMRGRLSTQGKRDALQLDFNNSGGQIIKGMTHGGVPSWDLSDLCYPGDGYVTHVTTDIYNQERFRSTASNFVAINGPDGPLEWVRTRAIRWGKKSGMSEGSPFMFKFKGGQIGADDGTSTLNFLDRLCDWGEIEAEAGRLSHITLFERDPDPEGFTAVIGGQNDTSARSFGEERKWGLWRLLHPYESGGGGIPGGIPAGSTGVPNTLSRRATVYTGVGGTRTRSAHTNAPQTLNALISRFNP